MAEFFLRIFNFAHPNLYVDVHVIWNWIPGEPCCRATWASPRSHGSRIYENYSVVETEDSRNIKPIVQILNGSRPQGRHGWSPTEPAGF